MMHVLIEIAVKSLLIAGLTLGLLAAMKRRSAAERSWVAHIGLLALVIVAFAPLVLPSWKVETPALLGQTPAAEVTVQTPAPVSMIVAAPAASRDIPVANVASRPALSPVAAATAAYAVPAAILLFITFLALARLIALRARADVLVDGHWLSALARAQRRMGFKHGTALLTSDDLSSPISWGLMRPVILLNTRAVEASAEAEAIIAHELAHVARMDWAKLLLARIATALFWFNPLVWVLAREAHQLREEAADDAVLAADIADTDYAELLVGVARHECPGLLLGAHGVAPSKNSLARRVRRVLDATSVRGPAARPFALGVFVGAVLIAAPLAALTLTPGGSVKQDKPAATTLAKLAPVPADLGHIIASGVSTSVNGAVAAIGPGVTADKEAIVARSPSGARAVVYPPDAQGRSRVVARGRSGATAVAYVDADGEVIGQSQRDDRGDSALAGAIRARVMNLTPEYIGAMRAAAPQLARVDVGQFVSLRAVGVTPQYAQDIAAAGFRNLDANELLEARAIGLDGAYVRAMIAAGVPPNLRDYIHLRTIGVPAQYVLSIRASGHPVSDVRKIVQMWALGVRPGDFAMQPIAPPKPPAPPRRGRPAASPPNWKTDGDPGG